MIWTPRAPRGALVAPHHLAAQAGLAVLREGGNAVEAMIAAAATISVVYPHMNGLGGDGFWLIAEPGSAPHAILGIGKAGQGVDRALYRGLDAIPSRGPRAAITVAGTLSGWQQAHDFGRAWGGRMPLARLFEDAVHYARHGFPATALQCRDTVDKRAELEDVPGFADTFLPGGAVPDIGATFRNPALADTLDRLAEAGLDDFYRGDLARAVAGDLERAGSPLTLADLEGHAALSGPPLSLRLGEATLYNSPAPTQGLAALLILGIFDRLDRPAAEGADYVHALVEATKRAFRVRDREITDPDHMRADPAALLTASRLAEEAAAIDPTRAAPWPDAAAPGDTVWLGAIDAEGRAVSFIHSLYWEFGSGVVLRDTGITWQNRGVSFALDPEAANPLEPGRRPFHTNSPAMAVFDDGRVMPYGTMGGDGQPQTQAALFTRYALYGMDLQAAVSAPRWLLGRTWGEKTANLNLEGRFADDVVAALEAAGHAVRVRGEFDALMGHAGALVRRPDGVIEGAADPRGDGGVAGY